MPVNRLLRAAFAALVITALASARPVAAQTVMKLANATINDVQHEWQKRFDAHKRITRFTLPIWSYVSVTGVLVYWMLYHLAPSRL